MARADPPKRRLKGLDEMPPPRRTMRQRYFWLRSKVRASVTLGWLWVVFKWAIVVAALWFVSQWVGRHFEL